MVFPQDIYCVCCGDFLPVSRGFALCDACQSKINWYPPNPLRDKMHMFSFDNVFSVSEYDSVTKEIIYPLKFDGRAYYADTMGRLMAELLELRMEELGIENPLIVPVPMHKDKESVRGYNQAALLAESVAKRLKLREIPLIIKPHETSSMRKARSGERERMLSGAFEINDLYRHEAANYDIILIDDVLTTGSTAEAASALLKKSGASRVHVLVFSSVKHLPA
ncbi:MAG: ComF family protein [Firmicutes bacterium]|nr:ComF family protein [Bacillota bacterium]